METMERHQKRVIRSVYPNGNDKRGYHMVSTKQDAERFSIPLWLTKWPGKLTPQTLGGY